MERAKRGVASDAEESAGQDEEESDDERRLDVYDGGQVVRSRA